MTTLCSYALLQRVCSSQLSSHRVRTGQHLQCLQEVLALLLKLCCFFSSNFVIAKTSCAFIEGLCKLLPELQHLSSTFACQWRSLPPKWKRVVAQASSPPLFQGAGQVSSENHLPSATILDGCDGFHLNSMLEGARSGYITAPKP